MLWGNGFDPEHYLEARHPDVTVEETDELPAGVLGAVDHGQRVIWLARGLPEHVRRCTLAYEVGRLERGPTGGDGGLSVAHGRGAAEWAARMLIGLPELCMAYAATAHLRARRLYAELARLLEVDEPTVRARLRGLTDDEQDAVTDALRGLPVAV